ncbi:MAG: glycoside hydrolase family 9 protein [Candidatus Symbiothrix sp.]|jgi:hypothetical protein|nr:glycoside hydrolase family 9 protein [Candidatus Symbiothrix sp.]
MKKHYSLLIILFLVSFSMQSFGEDKFILVNQFGYLPDAQKVAILRSPRKGPDAGLAASYPAPGNVIKVYEAETNTEIFSGSPVLIEGRDNNGAYKDNIDFISGDVVWHFDFSAVTTPGAYYIGDETNQQVSYNFRIAEDVYVDLFKAAFKMFYFQRFSAKELPYCYDAAWADGACYTQETQALNYMAKSDQSQKRDVSGGWFDAGDLNKYVNFLEPVFCNLILAYTERPEVWGDNMDIPESGNGIPDILDEIKWGLDWLLKMQNENGSVLSVVGGTNGAAPPSADKAQRYYGPENTSSTLTFALTCANAAQIFAKEPQPELKEYADRLRACAIKAWDWADENPNVTFYNNDNSKQPGSSGLCAGQNETDANGRKQIKLRAAVYLFGLTRDDKYGYYIRDHYKEFAMISWSGTLNEYYMMDHEACFYFDKLTDIPEYLNLFKGSLKVNMTNRLKNTTFEYSLNSLVNNKRDAYMSFIDGYNWGTNQYKGAAGNALRQVARSGWTDETSAQTYNELSAHYVHYFCGVNPLQYVYLTGMSRFGASKPINVVFHRWFFHDTKWDRNPAPGYIPGGPNPGSTNADGSRHFSTDTPQSKCYIDFNTDWSMSIKPNSSWMLTEPALYYQVPFVRLISKFVPANTTAIQKVDTQVQSQVKASPNPAKDRVQITLPEGMSKADIKVVNLTGQQVYSTVQTRETDTHSLVSLSKGMYLFIVTDGKNTFHVKVLKN